MYVYWTQIDILTIQYFLDVLEVFVNSYIFVSR
jgi:hypothetical protein